ncbi:M57 family metalloprotease [Dyadobacter sp. NIV53]|uniref:M57 family metalloprotease n=1 Tax=Dyadobacter sp. NIV53 TaxID=2861765 RepID=UPI001C881182|nr:M57 family metalloprotease [Dyadobacter sp. NIV53]
MKKLLYSIAMVACTYFVSSCGSTSEVTPGDQVEVTPVDVVDYSIMKSYLIRYYGFKDLVETDESFVAEGDIVFDKKDYKLYGKLPANARHYQYSGGIITKVKVVNVRFASSVSSEWGTAVKAAIVQWNSLDGEIEFKYSTTAQANEILVSSKSLGRSSVIAQAYFPWNGLPAPQGIQINSDFIYRNNFPAAMKVETMVHEMGHILGIGHTDVSSSYMSYISLTGCSGKDPESVMQPVLTQGWNGFSSCDKKAFAKLY